jgi:hypothetical protein
MNKSIFIVLILSALFNFSCVTDESCTQITYVKLTAGIYHVVPNDTTNINAMIPLIIDSLTVQGLRIDSTGHYQLVDSILYNRQSESSINLPLNNFKPKSTFKIKFNTILDTMTIFHANLNDYLSLECGCIVTHSIDSVNITKHYIDSVRIKIRDVNTTNAENIRLYK